jgi:formylglycine-generating enzyme required for sulfatase activity
MPRRNTHVRSIGVTVLIFLTVGLSGCGGQGEVHSGDRRISAIDGMEQVFVESGLFTMGSSVDDPQANADELPQHEVTLDSFWIDRTEVTNAQYAACIAAGACSAPVHSTHFGRPELENHPVFGVSWFEAVAYCAWAGRRLPTEAEWEKAARGADERLYPWGNEAPSSDRLNFDLQHEGTFPVGSFPAGASPYGALDMAGNVWEWTADTYDSAYYASSPSDNPPGPPESVNWRVIRGGAWNTAPRAVRAANRFWSFPKRDYFDGFRCAAGE